MGTVRVQRFDRGELKAPQRTPQGFLRVDGYVSRAGIYEYRNPDGSTRRELRPESELARSRAGYDGAPITIGHPRNDAGEPIAITADNVRDFEVGTVTGEARQDGQQLAASLVIKDKRGISAAEGGKHELSPGYQIDLVETPGFDPKFGRYDAIQTNIVINHLALVDRARGGSALRLRMDELEEIPVRIDGANMSDDQDKDLEKLRGENATLLKRVDELEAQLKTRLDAASSDEVKKATERADAAEQKLQQVLASRGADVQARVAIQRVAETFMGDHYRCDGKGDDEIKRDVVRKLDPSLAVDQMTSARLDGHFEALVKLHRKAREDYNDIAETLGSGRTRTDEAAAKKALDDKWNNGWKRPPASAAFMKKES